MLLFGSFILFDLIVRLEYRDYRKDWIADGKPPGMFFWPPECSLFGGSSRRSKLMHKWFLQTPTWMYDDVKAKNLLRLYRLCIIAGGIIFFSPFIYAFIGYYLVKELI